MSEYKQKQSQTSKVDEEIDEAPAAVETPEIDDLLDEIDDVLEENAQEFVEQYVQRGGE
jgi:prokaryotic ubiquitin-like protein Pup